MSVQNIVYCIGHITGGQNKVDKFVTESLFGPINDLDTEKKLVNLHMFDGASVYRKAQKYLMLSILCCNAFFNQSIPAIIFLKGGHLLRK